MSALVGAEGLARRFRFSAHVPIDLREPLQRREEAVVARLRIWAVRGGRNCRNGDGVDPPLDTMFALDDHP
jgi:hypothetical protein